MSLFKKRYSFFCLILCNIFYFTNEGLAQANKLVIAETSIKTSFPLAASGYSTTIYYDQADAAVVGIAARDLAEDIASVTDRSIPVNTTGQFSPGYAVVIGTIGHSRLVDSIVHANKINVTGIRGKWESFLLQGIYQPDKKVKNILLIAGSDRRGTAFAVFELSRKIGVSPFYWWADIKPVKRKQLFINGSYLSKSPSIKYRGIFINDEDWGMQPWAAHKMDTVIKDIGPHVYEKVFELLLRLKGNYIWPAMHPCTKAFYYYKENPQLADRYAIVIGGSHCEPMLRNNVFEWAENYPQEYGKNPGEWRYDLNKDQIYHYWDDRVKESVHYESVYTVGMRGVHDGSMPGPKDPDAKLKLLEQVIVDQREILGHNFGEPASGIPQIFIPYKEVLSLYRRGLPLADDITIIWPDDNYGYIRQLPNQAERKRSGGHGVYYHLSYWGAPQDYLWLSSTSPVLISYEMTKAYRAGASRLWVFNVGDIKPAEAEIQFSMDLAWDIDQWPPEKAQQYSLAWAREIFGESLAKEIAGIKNEYYELAQSAKPEHMNSVSFTYQEALQRLLRYSAIAGRAKAIYQTIDPSMKDAFFELILYPVLGAELMNEKILLARTDFKAFKTNSKREEVNTERVRMAFDSIALITAEYNKDIAGGKWEQMMSWHPRDQKVFDLWAGAADSSEGKFQYSVTPDISIQASVFARKKDSPHARLEVIKGLGINGVAVTLIDDQLKGTHDTSFIEFDLPPMAGQYEIRVKCLPDFDTDSSRDIRYGIAVNNERPAIVNVHAEAESKEWRQNVLRGYSVGKTQHRIPGNKNDKLRIWFIDKHLVINTIEFYKQPAN